jgi:putative MATE family efflux protein
MKDKEIYKAINKMAVPVLISAVGEIIFNIADQAIIGRTSVEGFAAVGVVANLLYLLTGTIGALAIAFAIMFGKAIANEDKSKQSSIFSSAMTFAIVLGIGFSLIAIIFGKLFLSKFYGLKASVLAYAYDYLIVACWGLGLNLVIFLFSGYFKNLKKTTVSLVSNIVSLTINFIIDYVLVFGKFGFPKLGVQGAAIGTVVGLSLNVAIFVLFFRKHRTVDFKFKIMKEDMKGLMKVYVPILGQDFVECTLFVMIITAIVTRLDTYSIAVYNLIEVIISFVILPAHAYGGITMTFVTQNYRKIYLGKLCRFPEISCVCSSVLVALLGGIILIFPESLAIITNDAKLINQTSSICMFAIVIQLINVISQIYKYSLQSMEYESWVFKFSTLVSIIASLMIYINVCVLNMGLIGVYIGMGLMYWILSIGYKKKINPYRC